jgi:hypothetical protein
MHVLEVQEVFTRSFKNELSSKCIKIQEGHSSLSHILNQSFPGILWLSTYLIQKTIPFLG